MFDRLEPEEFDAIMAILSVMYESCLVERVNLDDVFAMFGVAPLDPKQPTIIEFSSNDWMKSFILFNNTDREQFDLKVVDLESGKESDCSVSREELANMLGSEDCESIEALDVADLDPTRILH